MRYKKLDSFISQSYMDKLEEKIGDDLWESKTSEWKSEQERIMVDLNSFRSANTDYMLEGVKLLELARSASSLFASMSVDNKREMLKLVLSNPRITDGTIEYNYEKPFDMLVNVTNLNGWGSRTRTCA